MSRRSSDGEQEFGSDSFLDIIANIVGILIILIVIAGVKVARQKDGGDRIAMLPVSAQQIPDEPTGLTVAPTIWPWNGQDTLTTTSEDPSAEQREAEARNSDLDRQISELTLNLRRLQQTAANSDRELQQLLESAQQQQQTLQLQANRRNSLFREQTRVSEDVFRLQQSVLSIDEQATAYQLTLTSLSKRHRYVQGALQQVSMETQKLREVLESVEGPAVDGERLNHRLSPVGESVVEDELHFRLSAGRIAHVPLMSLLDRLKEQVSSRRSVVMKFHRYEGMVGPVEGFRMQYIVERNSTSPLKALQYGQNAFHISVARWTVLPAETLEAEPVAAALRIGSRFRQLLEATDPQTAITVWLYPGDFQYFHQIREFAHGLNLRVAARPLPEGTQIAGSPNGSRSTSQ
ncbi:MAG: hypothetical protein R3C59_20260 [Planctomycetaceae bacterium]